MCLTRKQQKPHALKEVGSREERAGLAAERTNSVKAKFVLFAAVWSLVLWLWVAFVSCQSPTTAQAGVPASASDQQEKGTAATSAAAAEAASAQPSLSVLQSPGLVALNKKRTVLLDKKNKRLLLRTHVVLRQGLLEMLCCLKQTKEHESIVALDGKAYVAHAGLLALGARPGRPVQYEPKYVPPSGQRVDIFVNWKDEQGREHRQPAQTWIRHALYRFHIYKLEKLPDDLKLPKDLPLRYDAQCKELTWFGPMTAQQRDQLLKLSRSDEFQKAVRLFYTQSQPTQMKAHWVFVGSGFYKDPDTGRQYYLAENGDFICVANFPDATLDVDISSTPNGTENLLFEAYTERIPPLGTEVVLELVPRPEKSAASKTEQHKTEQHQLEKR